MNSFLIPPYGAKFRFMDETWVTIGWTKKSDAGDHIWCHEGEATFVIGERTSGGGKWIAPIDEIGHVSQAGGWEYEGEPEHRTRQRQKADQNVGKRVNIVSGRLKLD